MLEDLLPTSSVLLCNSLGSKGLNVHDIHKEMIPVYGRKCDFHLFHPLKNHLGGKYFADDEEFEMEAQKWLRQQSKDFYAAGFDALVKRWDKCINVGGGHVEK
jgi:hypothetical protein